MDMNGWLSGFKAVTVARLGLSPSGVVMFAVRPGAALRIGNHVFGAPWLVGAASCWQRRAAVCRRDLEPWRMETMPRSDFVVLAPLGARFCGAMTARNQLHRPSVFWSPRWRFWAMVVDTDLSIGDG